MIDDVVSDGLDRFITCLSKNIDENEKSKVVVDDARVHDIMYSKSILEKIIEGDGVVVTHKLHEPFNSVGSVSVTGKDIIVTDSVTFNWIVSVASNVEVYPKTDGTIVMTFTFHGLTKKE